MNFGGKIIKGINDLETWCKQNNKEYLLDEWDYEKNLEELNKTIDNTGYGSTKPVFWICPQGHSYDGTVAHRTRRNNGCPYCSGHRVLHDYNDLETWCKQNNRQDLIDEWDYEKNNPKTPQNTSYGHETKVYWICPICKKSYQQSINSRTNLHTGCPKCALSKQTSFPEYAIEYYLSQNNCKVIHPYKDLGFEIDIYLPALKIGIEYDGEFYHRNRENDDIEKNTLCAENGIFLYRCREGLAALGDTSTDIHIITNNIDPGIKELLKRILHIDIDVNTKRDYFEISKLRSLYQMRNSIGNKKPELVSEWDYKRNEPFTPYNVPFGTPKKYYWICPKCNHIYLQSCANRNRGQGCPDCNQLKARQSGRKKVICVETCEIFDSVTLAAQKYNASTTQISNTCKGKYKTAKGYHWKYVE